MSKTLRAELVALFLEEAVSYIPAIRQNLTALSADGSIKDSLLELHRLYHTIKGAASQVMLTDISNGARFIENFLESLLEEDKEIDLPHLVALQDVTDLLETMVDPSRNSLAGEGGFHARVVALFEDSAAKGAGTLAGLVPPMLDHRQESLQAIRSITPLLRELAGCLAPGFGGHNSLVFGKINRALAVFAGTVRIAGLVDQYQLIRDFQLLLDKLQSDGHESQTEMIALVADFFQFLEQIFTLDTVEGASSRITERLQACHALLAVSPPPEKPVEEVAAEPCGQDIFAIPDADEESVLILEQLVENGAPDEPEVVSDWLEDPAQAEMTAGELSLETFEDEAEGPAPSDDPQLLLEIFRAESDEHFIVINNSLNRLEQLVEQPCEQNEELREILSEMRRAVHTLKGAAAMTGVSLLAQGAHSLEDLLDWLHDEAAEITPSEVGILAMGIDVIERLAQSSGPGGMVLLNRIVEAVEDHLKKKAGDRSVVDLDETALTRWEETVAKLAKEDASPGEADRREEPPGLPGQTGFLRVRLDDLDELMGIEGELVVARGAVETMLDEFAQTLGDFDTVKDNLRRKSQELEAGFEVKSLYGFNPVVPGGAGEAATGGFSEFDPIELDRYSQLNLIIRSLNEITVDINSIHATLTHLASDIRGQVNKQQLTMRLMQEKLMRIRMTPLSSLSRMLFRTVRETAKRLEKKVNLVISGEDVYMDRFVWAKITDPLMHVLRNALDHGIESARQRLAAGKPEIATIRLEAEQHSRFVVLTVADDGGGIDVAGIKARLRNEGLEADPDLLSEKELIEYLFHPSFSTRTDVSAISGRGVGLDVVRRNIQELRGSVQLINRPGQGVTFEFQIPFTLSVNRAAIVSAGGQKYAVPLQDIQQIKRYRPDELESGDGLYLRFDGNLVAVANLGYYLQLEGLKTTHPAGEGLLAIIFKKGEELRAVSIDQVVEQREIVVKNLGSHLTHVPGISGVTLTGTGGLIPILNLRELTDIQAMGANDREQAHGAVGLPEPLKVLIVDDSISVRHSVARLVEGQAWRQQQAVDGVDALAKLETWRPDVIVLDIEMPRMNGYEFKSSINNNAALRDIPVIMLTSRTSEKHRQKARELGIDHFMTKPYQEAAFIRLLEGIRKDLQ